jgi:chloramphenicol O-acetyltransferase type A
MHILNPHGWHRRATFDHFRAFEQPFFNVCTEIDITALKAFVARQQHSSLFLAYHYLTLRALNSVAEFRHRLQGNDVLVHDTVHGSTTVLRDDDSFAFADLVFQGNWDTFAAQATSAIAQAKDPQSAFTPTHGASDVVHFSTLPWIRFTSVSHPHSSTDATGIPRISFGKLSPDAGRWMLPLSVEVHHGLVDGVHVGRMLERLALAVGDPERALLST